MRYHRSLSGSWQFQLDQDGTLKPDTLSPDREIPVPMPWQAAFPELQRYSGFAWYRRTFDLDEEWLRGEVLLRFGAVDYWCQVFVNGELAGEHEGGYTQFTIPVKRYARAGSNELAVRVYDAAQTGICVPRWPAYSPDAIGTEPPFDANNIPHGKQEWYINVGGIWQDVSLIAVPARYIERMRIVPDIHTGRAHITVELGGDEGAKVDGAIRVSVRSQNGEVAQATAQLVTGQNTYELSATVDSPRLWSIEDPYLYTANVSLSTAGGEDELSARFGFREITTRDGRLVLNGEPIYLLSVLDQDFYPDTIYTVPSEGFLRDEFRKAKALGFNNLRCHIKPPDPLYLDIADEMGMLVWAEIPSWRTFSFKNIILPDRLALDDTIKRRVAQTLVEMVRRDFNHPSLIIWTIVNEDWGTSLPLSASDREWVSQMYALCKELDPTRLVTDNSACPAPWGPNVHVRSDLDDFHVYANIPDQAPRFEQTMEQFNMRPDWTYSAYGDAQRTGQEPLILSEFGNWGLPSLRSLREAYGGDPPWFDLGPWWSGWEGGPGWPAGVEERFHKLGLDPIWGDYEQFATATQWHQFAAMKFEIEAIRRQPRLSGYVITELADAYWEANGLLDFARKPKVYYDRFREINAPDMIIPQVERYAHWDDDVVRVVLHLSHFGPADWSGAHLRWRIGGGGEGFTGELDAPGFDERGTVKLLDILHWMLPPVEEAQTIPAHFTLLNAKGEELAHNSLDLMVIPSVGRQPGHYGPVAVILREDVFAAQGGSGAAGSPASATGVEREPHGVGLNTGPLTEAQVPGEEDTSLHVLARAIRRLSYRTSRRLMEDTKVAVTNYPNPELLDWVRNGGDMLFFTRGPSPFFWVQGRGGTYSGDWITSFSWLRPEIHRRLKVDNPLGMPFMNVMPNGTILGLPVEDPALQGDFLAGMIAGWVRHPAVHTVQFRYGKGRVIMTTLEFEQPLHYDPVAIALFNDLLEYLCSDACQPTLTLN